MRILTCILVGGIFMAGAIASWRIHQRAQVDIQRNDAILQEQKAQLAQLIAHKQSLSNQRSEFESVPAADLTAEVSTLRLRAEALRKQINQLAAKVRSWTPPTEPSADSGPDSSVSRHVVSDSTSEDDKVELYKLACAAPHSYPPMNSQTMDDARNLSHAVRVYARQHEGEFPSTFEEAADYFDKDKPPPRTSGFELVFQGSQKELSEVPEQAVALLREKQAWQTPRGNLARIYVMAGGEVKVVEAQDHFQAWEAEHVIPPPAAPEK